jgi:hypothetical protein
MTVTPTTTPPKDPARAPTWKELVNQERRLLDGLIQFMRARSRRPPAEIEEIVARALEEALAEIIAKEPDEERADELRRRAAARALVRMFREGPRLVYSRPLPIQNSKSVIARPANNRHKREVESFQAMLDERRRRRPHLIVDNDPQGRVTRDNQKTDSRVRRSFGPKLFSQNYFRRRAATTQETARNSQTFPAGTRAPGVEKEGRRHAVTGSC